MVYAETRPRPQLSEEAASYVRDQITSGTLAPGTPVRPEVIAAELGISSTPAREALQSLRAEGFLDLAPRRGFTVARLTGDDIRDIYLVQAWVASELAARAAKRGDAAVIGRLEEIHADLIRAAEVGDLEQVERMNHRFHRQINLASGSPKLAWVMQIVSRYAPRRFYASIEGWSEATVGDHTEILDAIRAGDPELARARMHEHTLAAGRLLASRVEARQRDSDV
ncbi:GntR family transcriptional regulator [Microbacterium immunditiarum]|uniref:DNA-binding GntR family transcriptional regulator n=1 Tax=Microbacterium immunditiarum TaxID=337480 RepID=A0A7Y9GNC3_9MICO|nr:GntR family transcriptional regulator [Microbacterium immunditiarum]NYE19651.1 DNA-binding GntR family transcriptional regulator [Microbacterium immunditiarum]